MPATKADRLTRQLMWNLQQTKGQNAMANQAQPLTEFIRTAIRERGPVTFRWFMEQALYPAHGFYSSCGAGLGDAAITSRTSAWVRCSGG